MTPSIALASWLCFIVLPIIGGLFLAWCEKNDSGYFNIWSGIADGMLGTLITFMITGLIIGLCLLSLGAPINDAAYYYGDNLTYKLNGVSWNFADQRYIELTLPKDFYGRVSIINTDTRHSLFSVSVSQIESYEKTLSPKRYKIDTAYSGTLNQITVEIENKEVSESHVYTIATSVVRSSTGEIFDPVRRVRMVME